MFNVIWDIWLWIWYIQLDEYLQIELSFELESTCNSSWKKKSASYVFQWKTLENKRSMMGKLNAVYILY